MTAVTNPRKVAPDSVAAQLIEQARAEGVSLVGPGSPLAALTKQVLESALEAELDEHLGYEHGNRAGKAAAEGGNERNGTRGKEEFTPFLADDVEIRRVICTTNAIGSLNARFRRGRPRPRPLPDRPGSPEMLVPGGAFP